MKNSTNKPIIVVDIDDVLSDQVGSMMKYLRDEKGFEVTHEQYSEIWDEMLGISDERARVEFTEFASSDYGYHNLDVIPGSREVLQKLKSNFELAVLTSRSMSLRDVTFDWINEHFPDIFDEIYVSGIYDNGEKLSVNARLTKADKLLEIGTSYLIDDQPKHVNGAAEVGVKGLLFGDYAWNRDESLRDAAFRMKGWNDVAEFFGV